MRYLFVGNFAAQGGSPLATIPIALKLRSEGHEVSFSHWVIPKQLALFTENELFNLSLHTQSSLLTKIIYLTRIARQYDLIIAVSELTITYACQIAGWLTNTPVCGEIQVNLDLWIEDNSASIHHQLSRFFYPKLQAVRCVSQGLAQYAISELKIPAQKVFTIYNPFNLENITELAKLPLPEIASPWFARPVILCAGRLEKQKRFDLAIIALSYLQRAVNLVILGEGPEKNNLLKQIEDLNLTDSVYLAGFQTNPYPFFRHAKLFLLCSDYEGFGRVIVDAMVVGCPVVTHDCPFGPAEILIQGKCGILMPDNQPETIAQHLLLLLDNPQLCSNLIIQGKQRSMDFSEQFITEKYSEELSKI